MVARTSGSFFSNRYLLYLLESNVGKKDPRCHNMPITIGSNSKKAGCATRKGLIDCFLSNEHRASKTWTKIENFSLYSSKTRKSYYY